MIAVPTHQRFHAMGTEVSVLTPAPAPHAVEAVNELFAEWEAALSRFRPSSELSRLNAAAGRPVRVSALLLAATRRAIAAARATGGAFDPLLGRQIVAAGYARSFELPPAAPLRLAAPRPGGAWREIVLDPVAATICLPTGAALDLGGIAKGMAVDAAVALLRNLGVTSGLVNAGGDLRAVERSTSAWPIALTDVPCELVTLTAGALATSSTLRRRWRTGSADQHHLIDPRTGAPARSGVRSVTVAAPTCTQAEVAAKAALVMGPDAGADFLHGLGLDAILSPTDGDPIRVGAWPGRGSER